MTRYDAIIVGARCAGASLAMLLARRGLRLLAVDRARFPSDTVSTHFMWPRTTAAMARWGLLERLARTGCPLIEAVTLDYGPLNVRGAPDAVEGASAMYCPRRHILDHLLVTAARDAGAEIREATTFEDIVRDGERVVGIRCQGPTGTAYEERASVIVGADGLWSRVARAAGAPFEVEEPSRTCGFYAYWAGVPTDGVEFYLRHGREILVFPTHDGLTCIWAGRPNGEFPQYRADIERAYLGILDLAPGLAARVRAGKRATSFKGTNKLPNFYRRAAGKGWALVGDAAYHRDPLTGMGMGDAFLGAQLLADAILDGLSPGADLDAALAGHATRLREATWPVFQYTLKAASLDDPAPLLPFYAAVRGAPALTRDLMNVVAGVAPANGFFSRANIMRALADAPRQRQ